MMPYSYMKCTYYRTGGGPTERIDRVPMQIAEVEDDDDDGDDLITIMHDDAGLGVCEFSVSF